MDQVTYQGPITDKTIEIQAVRYAGFWIRAGAQVIDGLLCLIIIWVLFIPLTIAATALGISYDDLLYYTPLYSLFVYWLYESLFLSSILMATPGKMIAKINVSTSGGGRISFLQATARFIVKLGVWGAGTVFPPLWFVFVFSLISPLAILFDAKKRALHDIVASTQVSRK